MIITVEKIDNGFLAKYGYQMNVKYFPDIDQLCYYLKHQAFYEQPTDISGIIGRSSSGDSGSGGCTV